MPLLGTEQAEWLVRELSRSRATWKVVVADLPLGLVPRDAEGGLDADLVRVLRGLHDHAVRDVVWISAGTHYAAAHHYDPRRAGLDGIDPFWEFVAGPIHAGTSLEQPLDPGLGPRVEFVRPGDHDDQSPRAGNQFFGHLAIDAAGALSVSLRDVRGRVLHTTTLTPDAAGRGAS